LAVRRKGVIELNKEQVPSIDELTLELIDFGVDDVLEEDDSVTIYTQPDALSKVLDYLNEVGIEVSRAELEFIPKNYISVSEEEDGKYSACLKSWMTMTTCRKSIQMPTCQRY